LLVLAKIQAKEKWQLFSLSRLSVGHEIGHAIGREIGCQIDCGSELVQ
jgi:hypothetical protein